MFCRKCGSQVAAGERFCTKCGSPVDGAMPAAPNAPAPVQAKPPASKGPIIVIIVAIIVIVAAVMVLAMTLLRSGDDASQSASASRANGSNASSAAALDESDDAPGSIAGSFASDSAESSEIPSNSTPPESPSAPAQSPRTTDGAGIVSNAESYKAMNLFLSNFSEVDMQDMPSVSGAGIDQLTRFALSHDVINSLDLIEVAPTTSTPTNGAGNRLGSRESADRLNELLERYMGTTVDFGKLPSNSPYIYGRGYVYFNGVDVQRTPVGVVNVTGSEQLTEGRVKVYFDVYGSSGGYDATDEGLYALSADELMKRLGCTAPAYSGEAVVQTGGSNERTGGLTLVSYERER